MERRVIAIHYESSGCEHQYWWECVIPHAMLTHPLFVKCVLKYHLDLSLPSITKEIGFTCDSVEFLLAIAEGRGKNFQDEWRLAEKRRKQEEMDRIPKSLRQMMVILSKAAVPGMLMDKFHALFDRGDAAAFYRYFEECLREPRYEALFFRQRANGKITLPDIAHLMRAAFSEAGLEQNSHGRNLHADFNNRTLPEQS